MTTWKRNETDPVQRSVTLFIYKDDGVTPAPLGTNFSTGNKIRISGGAYAAAAGTMTNVGVDGEWEYVATQAETNVDACEIIIMVPAVTGFSQANAVVEIVKASQDVNVTAWLGTTVATPTVAGIPKVEDATLQARLTSTRGTNLDNLDATVSSRATPTTVDTQLSGTHGAGAWGAGTSSAVGSPVSVVPVLQNTATTVSIFMRDATTGNGLPGISPSAFTIKAKKSNQTSFSTITPTVTDTGLGWYDLAILSSHVDTLGKMPLNISATGALPLNNLMFDVIAMNVFTDSVRAGLTALPNANFASGSGIPLATQVRDILLGAARQDYVELGTVGEGMAIATSLLQGNFYMDNVDNTDPNGQTSARLRCFHNADDTNAATYGGSGENEFATFLVTTTYSGPNKIIDHRVAQQ